MICRSATRANRSYFTEAASYVSAAYNGQIAPGVDKQYGNRWYSSALKCDVCRNISFDNLYEMECSEKKPYWMRQWIESIISDDKLMGKDVFIITKAVNIPYNGGCGVNCCLDIGFENKKRNINEKK